MKRYVKAKAEGKRQKAKGRKKFNLNAYPTERLDPKTLKVWLQFVAAATSGGAHLEEANAASSRAHFITLNRGALREFREAHYWIRLIEATKLNGWQRAAPLKSEASELPAFPAAFCLLPFAFLKVQSPGYTPSRIHDR